MRISVALITLLASAAILSGTVECQTDHTYVDNQSSSWTLVATTVYLFNGNSQFINRYIGPGTWQQDEYSEGGCCLLNCEKRVKIQLRLQYQTCTYAVYVDCDNSIVGVDNADKTGVDIYLSIYGYIQIPDPSYPLQTTVLADSVSGGC